MPNRDGTGPLGNLSKCPREPLFLRRGRSNARRPNRRNIS